MKCGKTGSLCLTCMSTKCVHIVGDEWYLTKRQVDVMGLVGKGWSNKRIAGCLGWGTPSIKIYVSAIMRKLKLENRTEVALWYLENKEKLDAGIKS